MIALSADSIKPYLMNLTEYLLAIETQNFRIATLDSSIDFNRYLSWFSNPEVKKNIEYGKNRTINVKDLKDYVLAMNQSPSDLLCGVFSKDGLHLGNIKFGPVDFESGTATMGVLIGSPEARGQGVFGEVFRAVSQHLAEKFQIRRFTLGVGAHNSAAIRAYEKAGFVTVSEGKSADLSPYFLMEYKISG